MLVTFLFSSSSTPIAEDSVDLGIEHVARQPVGRDPEAHHAAGHRPGLEDRHLVAEAAQVVRGREAGGAGTDDQNALAGGLGGRVEGPALLDRLVADEALDRVDADGLVELPPVAGGLAGVVTDATHDRRERVVLDDLVPGTLVPLAAVLGLVQPGLAVLAGGAGVVTGGSRSTYWARSVRQLPVLLARLEPTSSVMAKGRFFSVASITEVREGCRRAGPSAPRGTGRAAIHSRRSGRSA